jgi:soluble lytic murein transglycosylase-like protein
MRFAAVALLLLCSAFSRDFNLSPEPSAQRFIARIPGVRWLFQKRQVNWRAVIASAAKKHNVPVPFVKSIIAAESNFDCDAMSPKGAIGAMQLMPETAQLLGADPTIPEQNVEAGTHYLRILMNRYRNSRNSMKRVIAAYNAGPGVVDRYRGVPPYRETRNYVARVMAFMKQFQKERG